MKIIHNNVLVLPDAKPKKIGSIHVPESAQDSMHTSTGVIVELGNGIPGREMEMEGLHKGMRVIYARHSGRAVTLDGGVHHLMAATEILAEVETDSPDPAP